MLKLNWQPLRVPLLAATCAATLLVGAKLATLPKPDSAEAPAETNTLPTSAPITQWQLIDSAAIQKNDDSKFGRRYRYERDNLTLDAEQHYMISDGNVSRYLFVHSPVRTANANLKTKFQPNVGYYGLVSHNSKAYLSACINPRGGSTVTEQQFTQNRYSHDLQVSRVVPWLLGQESLIDYRCLWTFMSIPFTNGSKSGSTSEAEAYKNLEAAWFSWHEWWQANFPAK